jgi:hypothetical protein
MIANQVIIYQFGEYVFKKGNLDNSTNIGLKNQLDDNAFMNGSSRVNGIAQDTKQDYISNVSFLLDEDDDMFSIKKYFLSGSKKIYFLSKDKTNKVHFYWNWATCEGFTDEIKPMENNGAFVKQLNAKFRLHNPYYYEANDDDFMYIDEQSYIENKYDTGLTYDSGKTYDSKEVSANKFLRDLTDQEKYELFWDWNPQYKLNVIDRFFKKEPNYRYFNNIFYTEDLSNSAWVKTDLSVALNQGTSLTLNQDATKVTINSSPTFPNIKQINLSTIRGVMTLVIDVKLDTGNLTHIVLKQNNPIDGAIDSGLMSIVSGTNLGDGWYRHKFTRTATVQTDFTGVEFQFLTSGGGAPAATSSCFIKNPILYTQSLSGSNIPTYQPVISGSQEVRINLQKAFTYTLTNNNLTYLYSNPLNLLTNATNTKLLIRLSQLSKDEYIEIINTSTNTGFRLTWISNTASPQSMVLYTFSRELYNNITGNIIEATNSQYKLEPLKRGMLNFRGLYQSSIFDSDNSDFLQIQKKTASNFAIAIKNININH